MKAISPQKISGPLFPARFRRHPQDLADSIKRFGILYPIVVWHDGKSFLIIDGHARWLCAQQSGIAALPCLVHEKGALDRRQAFLLFLELNRFSRGFTLVEKADCLRMAADLFGREDIPEAVFERMDVRKDERTLAQYRDLLTLPEPVLNQTVARDISLAAVLGLLRFPKNERGPIAQQLFGLPMNTNRFAETTDLLFAVVQRESLSALGVLEEALSALAGEINLTHKEQKLRDGLHQRKNPRFYKRLAEFRDGVGKLALAKNVRISPAPYFEGDYIEVSVRFHSAQEVSLFAECLQDKEWGNFFVHESPLDALKG